LIVRALCIVPFIYSIPAISVPPFIFRLIQDSAGYANQDGELIPRQFAMVWVVRLLLSALAVAPVAIFITSIVAAVQFFRGKQSGRIWAIGCGITFLAASVPSFGASALVAYYSGGGGDLGLGLPLLGLIQLAAGILILVAFLPRDSASEPLFQSARSVRVKGDGTTSLTLYLAVAVMLGGCSLGDLLCRRWAERAHLPFDPSLLHANLTWFGALVLGVTLHELGHMVAGRIVGMKLLSFRIGPVQAALEDGKWRPIRPRSLQSMFAAGVSMIPANPLSYDRRQAIVGAAGGTLANFLVGTIALSAMFIAKGSPYESNWDFLSETAIINFAFFVVNLIPAKEAAAYSDGARIYQILTGSVLEDYRRIMAMTQATTVTSLRPKDYDIQLIERIAATDTPGFDRAFLLLVAGDHYFDSGDMESARQKFREAEALYDRETSFWSERCGNFVTRAVYLLADAAMAEKWWQRRLAVKSRNPGKKNYFPACAYFTITGRLREAEVAWQAELEKTKCSPDTGGRAFDLHNLERLREMMDEAAREAGGAPRATLGQQLDPR
jgi:hypothetical protein